MEEKVLEVKDLKVSFRTDFGKVQAVRGVSFDLFKGETLCIVGESGSGKSVTSKAIMGILAANSIVEGGNIIYHGEDLLKVSEEEFHRIRGHKIGMIFQDPLSSLNPIMKIGKQITEAMLINSNLLKRKYDELISNDLTAYLNEAVIRDTKIERVINDYKKRIDDLQNSLSNNHTADGEKALNELKKEAKINIAKVKKEANGIYKERATVLKDNLNKAKDKAKIEVKQLKKQLANEFKCKEDALKTKISNSSDINEINSYKAELEKIKIEYVSSIKITKKEAKKRALEVMKEVGIPQPEKRFKQYPFEFSGGMRQRIVIAIALIASPEILICDEPTTALDVTIQAQILELINDLKKKRNLSCIFITHDLGVVANMADRVAVMYAGKIVEYGKAEEIFYDPKHPYTWALLSSIPDVDSKEKLDAIPGTPPNMVYPPKGDAFALRSKYALKIDFEEEPPYFKVSDTHYASTWLLHENAPKVEMPAIVKERIRKSLKGDDYE